MRWHCWPSAAECQVRTTANAISLYTMYSQWSTHPRDRLRNEPSLLGLLNGSRRCPSNLCRNDNKNIVVASVFGIGPHTRLDLGRQNIRARSSLPERRRGPIASGLGLYGWGLHDMRLPSNMASVAPRSHCTAKKHKVPAILPASCPCRGCSWLLRRMRFPALAAAVDIREDVHEVLVSWQCRFLLHACENHLCSLRIVRQRFVCAHAMNMYTTWANSSVADESA